MVAKGFIVDINDESTPERQICKLEIATDKIEYNDNPDPEVNVFNGDTILALPDRIIYGQTIELHHPTEVMEEIEIPSKGFNFKMPASLSYTNMEVVFLVTNFQYLDDPNHRLRMVNKNNIENMETKIEDYDMSIDHQYFEI